LGDIIDDIDLFVDRYIIDDTYLFVDKYVSLIDIDSPRHIDKKDREDIEAR
jgi:hypothetical protein